MKGWLRSLKVTYLTADPRSLGLFRIGFGLVLLSDLARRYQEIDFWYTNAGLLPNHTLLWRPPAGHVFSLFFVASSPQEARLGFAICAAVYALFTLGYRTRLLQVLVVLCRVSLNSRLAVLENGGDMVINLLCMFTLALPLGRRFSVDAWLLCSRDDRARDLEALAVIRPPELERRPVVSLAMLGLILQFAAVYFFNAISKQGAAWTGGLAVHYALHQDKLVTWLGVWMRENLSVTAFHVLTWTVLAVEWTGFVLIITPVFIDKARLLAVCTLPLLHLGFALGLNLGAFSPAMMSFFPLLLTRAHWDALARWLQRRTTPTTIELDVADQRLLRGARWLRELDRFGRITWRAAASAGFRVCGSAERGPSIAAMRWLSEAFVVVLMLAIASEIVNDNTSVPLSLRVPQPAWAKAVIEYPRLLQGWRMFAPDPPLTDSMIHVDAVTADGAHVDPYNAVASRQHFPAGDVVPEHMGQSQFFTMYSDRIGSAGYAAYRQAFLEWLLAYPQRTGRASDCLTRFDVYLVTDRSPAPGARSGPTPVSREKFMEYTAPANGDCRSSHPGTEQHLAQTDPR
jgi:hypothetical protein